MLVPAFGSDPGNALVLAQIGVDQRCALGDARLDVEDRRQRLVIDFDQARRFSRGLGRLRRHRGHGIADVAHAVDGKYRLVLEVDAGVEGKVTPTDRRPHPGHAQRLVEPDVENAGVGVRRTHHGGMKQASELEVRGIARGPGDLLDSVGAREVVTHVLGGHRSPPAASRGSRARNTLAASRTASMICR